MYYDFFNELDRPALIFKSLQDLTVSSGDLTDFKCIDVNNEYCLVYDRKRENAIGKSAEDILPSCRKDILAAFGQDKVFHDGSYHYILIDNKTFSVLIDGAPKTFNSSAYDFLSHISHEIRTPLNGIVGMLSLLVDTELNKEQIDYVDTIRVSSFNLMSIVNDILDVAKLETKKLKLTYSQFSIRTCVESSFDIISADASKKGLDYSFYVDERIPEILIGDPQRLKQVMINLLSNAVKFTSRGFIKMIVSLEEIVADSVLVTFRCIDSGIGISQQDSAKLFKPFTQIDQSIRKEYEGTGLGLVICKQLCELMGGTVGFSSEIGAGSTFCFNAKFAIAHGKSAAKVNLNNKRVIVVDDNEVNRKFLQTTLYKWKCSPHLFSSAAEAILCLQNSPKDHFDLALIDIRMPKIDGFALARQIKNEGFIFPIIAISSFVDRGNDFDHSLFTSFLTKPIHQDKLLTTMMDALGETEKIVAASPKRPSNAKPHSIIIAEDIYINQKVLIELLKKIGFHEIMAVDNGQKLLDELEKKRYDIALIDFKMPIMDGKQAMRTIIERYKARKPICIAVTAAAMKGDQEQILSCGFDGYLSKPIDLQSLNMELDKFGI